MSGAFVVDERIVGPGTTRELIWHLRVASCRRVYCKNRQVEILKNYVGVCRRVTACVVICHARISSEENCTENPC